MRQTRRLSLHLSVLLLAALPLQLPAQQYRSEVRVLEQSPEDKPAVDAEKLLSETNDPYRRALLLRELAGRAARDENYEQASRFLNEAIGLGALSGPAQQAMQQDLSQLLVASGDPDAIIRGLERSVRNNPDASAAQQAALGAAYAAKKRYGDALPLLQRAVARSQEPEENWLRALLAAQVGLKRFSDAAGTVDALLVRNPREPEYWQQAVALKLRAGNQREAQAALEVSARLGYVSDADQRRQLAALTARIGAPYAAATQLESWMEGNEVPRSSETLRELASYWLAARESSPAIRTIQQTLERSTDVALLLQLGQLYMDRENYGQAERAFARALSSRPQDADARMSLAVARYQQADISGALEAFRAAASSGKHAALARDWIEYLESGQARDKAMQAASARAQRLGDADTELERSVLGERVDLGEGNTGGQTRVVGGHTPVGAEAGGSADGVIPAWTGGIKPSDWPESYARGDRLVDPFATDTPRFTVTPDNMEQHARYLSDGHRALLQKYPSYRMPVYPTRRSVSYPPAIYRASEENRQRARLIGSDSLTGARLGVPFPRPESGVEVMWNHRVRYRGDSVMSFSEQAVVEAGGTISQQLFQTERVYFRYGNVDDPVDIDRQNVLLYYLSWFGRDRGAIDFLALVHETANAADRGRAVWVLPPRAQRLYRVPPVGYDQPFPGSGGVYFVDMLDMYNGAFDRYNWKLVGKREMLVPYNGFKLVDGSVRKDALLQAGHPDPSHFRYERHRVWVIEAEERPGTSHSFGKRVFYVDEDSWNVVLVENYDRQGRLWRFQEGNIIPIYNTQAANAMPVTTYDLRDGRYFINRLVAETDPAEFDVPGIRASDFLPASVRARYIR